MREVVFYATGSPILPDIEESLHRAGIAIRAAVRNHPGRSYLTDASLEIEPAGISAELLELPFLVPLFTPTHRKHAADEARARGFSTPSNLIDLTVSIPRTIDFEPGLYIGVGVTLGALSRFGAFTFINRGASVGHHVRTGDYVSIGPGVVIAGAVTIEDGALIGAGAVLMPQVTIGADAIVGAGAVVTRNVLPGTVMVGNPARVVRRKTSVGP
ncbi:MAG: acetyltransferase [Bradyrhizobium sp.]|nr:acetyltransferase [Bradyrhizobium sp.]